MMSCALQWDSYRSPPRLPLPFNIQKKLPFLVMVVTLVRTQSSVRRKSALFFSANCPVEALAADVKLQGSHGTRRTTRPRPPTTVRPGCCCTSLSTAPWCSPPPAPRQPRPRRLPSGSSPHKCSPRSPPSRTIRLRRSGGTTRRSRRRTGPSPPGNRQMNTFERKLRKTTIRAPRSEYLWNITYFHTLHNNHNLVDLL